jgi:DNA polymerase III delta subunit
MTSADANKPAVTFLLLMGDDTLSREKARIDAIARASGSGSEVVVENFDPGNQAMASFTERIITPSLFPVTRFFLVREAHLLKKNDLGLCADVFPFDLPDVHVIFETEKTASKKGRGTELTEYFGNWIEAFRARAEKHPEKFSIAEYVMPPEWQMSQWVQSRTPLLLDRLISQKDAEYLIECVGGDSATIYSELQKLDVYLPPQKPIDRSAIEAVCGSTRLMTQFELAQALGMKNFPKVLEIIESLYRASVYVPLYISAIFRHFWALFRIATWAKSHRDEMAKFQASLKRYNKPVQDEIGIAIGVAAGLLTDKQKTSVFPKIVKPNLVPQALSFTEAHYKMIFQWLGDYDVGVKTGRIEDDKTGFQLLCYKIFRVAEISG